MNVSQHDSAEVDQDKFFDLLESSLRDIGIPPCPAILERIKCEMGRDDPNFKRLGAIVETDVGLAAGLISIVNSPYFGYRGRVRSVNEALMLLGLKTASQAIAGLLLKELFPANPSLIRFWDASASIARLSGWLSLRYGGRSRVRADDAYTFGLFRDCGIAVLIQRFKDYPAILEKANAEKELSFTAVEELEYPTNHAVVGGLLAQSWWLPEEICLGIRYHHEYATLRENPDGLPPATQGMIACAQLAEHLLQHHTGKSRTQEWAKAASCCLEFLGIGEDELAGLYQESGAIIAST